MLVFLLNNFHNPSWMVHRWGKGHLQIWGPVHVSIDFLRSSNLKHGRVEERHEQSFNILKGLHRFECFPYMDCQSVQQSRVSFFSASKRDVPQNTSADSQHFQVLVVKKEDNREGIQPKRRNKEDSDAMGLKQHWETTLRI